MKIRCNTTLISALLLSLGLVALIPGSLRFASTWRDLYLYGIPGMGTPNLLMILGFHSLGLEIIGLIVLWTGYRKRERWAWFVMLTILLFLVFPPHVLTVLVTVQSSGPDVWSQWFQYIREGDWPSIWIAVGVLTFLVMLVALLLPIKAFFWRSANSKAADEYHGEDESASTGPR